MFDRLIAGCRGGAVRSSANLRQDRVAIFIAVAIEELLMGAERSHSAPDFLAKLAVPNRGRAGSRCGFDRSSYLVGFRQRNRFNPAVSLPAFDFRLSGDGLNKRHGLRDQKVALDLPLHFAPQPAGISAKSRPSIKPRFCLNSTLQGDRNRWAIAVAAIYACRA
jgi:hypothetical protein